MRRARIGFAWSPGTSGKWSVRGGYGIYFNFPFEELNLQFVSSPPFGITSTGAAAGGFGIAQVLLLVISLAYSIGLIGWKGQTVGMMALRIKVVLTTGQPVDYGRAALRWVGSIISGMVLCLGYLWIAWDPDKQAWHDKIAGTYVVKA